MSSKLQVDLQDRNVAQDESEGSLEGLMKIGFIIILAVLRMSV